MGDDLLLHTPYDGSRPLFKIGLARLDLKDWIEVDAKLPDYLQQKSQLIDTRFGDVFVGGDCVPESQREVLALLLEHLPSRFPEIYRTQGDGVEISNVGAINLNQDQPPLLTAAQLVQEDLVILHRSPAGWKLKCACVCFPSSWNLREKHELPMQEVHGPVPGFGPETRNASLINRIFDNLKTDKPVRRFNWSIYSDPNLFHGDRSAEQAAKNADGVDIENTFLRVEHQTLRRLKKHGDILFTIRIHLEPMSVLKKISNGQQIAAGLINSINALKPEELDYKGLSKSQDELIQALHALQGKN